MGRNCVDLAKAPFVCWSHLQLRSFVLDYSRTAAGNSLSPVSLLPAQRCGGRGREAWFRVARPSFCQIFEATSPTKPPRSHLLVKGAPSGQVGIAGAGGESVRGSSLWWLQSRLLIFLSLLLGSRGFLALKTAAKTCLNRETNLAAHLMAPKA